MKALILAMGIFAANFAMGASSQERVFEGAFCLTEGERYYQWVNAEVFDVFYCSAGTWRFLMQQDNSERQD